MSCGRFADVAQVLNGFLAHGARVALPCIPQLSFIGKNDRD
jgi:hypothetical protein